VPRDEQRPVVEVSIDAGAVEAQRSAATVPKSDPMDVPLDRLIPLLSRVMLETPRHVRKMRESTPEQRERLRAMATGEDGSSSGARANAALLLGAIDETLGARPLAATLREADAASVVPALVELVRNQAFARTLVTQAPVAAALRDWEDSPDPLVQLTLTWWQLANDPLARIPPTTVERMEEWLTTNTDRDVNERVHAVLRMLVARPSTDAAPAAAHALLKGAVSSTQGQQRAWSVQVGARGADGRSLDILEQLAAGDDPSIAAEALHALARLRGTDMAPRLMQRLSDAIRQPRIAEALGLALEGSGDRETVARLAEVALEDRERRASSAIGLALLHIGGPLARSTAVGLLPAMFEQDRQRAEWILSGLTLADALQAAVDAGLIDRLPGETDLARLAISSGRTVADPVGAFWAVLHEQQAVLTYDAEGSYPPEHDRVVGWAAAASRGLFRPEAVRQTGSPEGRQHDELAYELSFVHDERLYRIGCRFSNDYYDSAAVFEVVHRALADAGHEERFVPLAIGGQVAYLFFGRPDAVRRFCERVRVPLQEERRRRDDAVDRWKELLAMGLP
jgi:hypothetical protein